jgi:hypothetical protein
MMDSSEIYLLQNILDKNLSIFCIPFLNEVKKLNPFKALDPFVKWLKTAILVLISFE